MIVTHECHHWEALLRVCVGVGVSERNTIRIYNFHVLTTNHITTKLTNPNQDQRHKYHHLTTTLHLTLKMTAAQVVETSVTHKAF